MPTPVTHAAVGFAIGAWMQERSPAMRVCVAAAACAALPDIDVLWSPLPPTSPFSHRAITHSLAFALISALVVTAVFFRGDQWKQQRGRIGLVLTLALVSHGFLDALTAWSQAVASLAPFSMRRFRFPWTPLGSPRGSLAWEFCKEALFVLLPALLLGWWRIRDRGRDLVETPPPA